MLLARETSVMQLLLPISDVSTYKYMLVLLKTTNLKENKFVELRFNIRVINMDD